MRTRGKEGRAAEMAARCSVIDGIVGGSVIAAMAIRPAVCAICFRRWLIDWSSRHRQHLRPILSQPRGHEVPSASCWGQPGATPGRGWFDSRLRRLRN